MCASGNEYGALLGCQPVWTGEGDHGVSRATAADKSLAATVFAAWLWRHNPAQHGRAGYQLRWCVDQLCVCWRELRLRANEVANTPVLGRKLRPARIW